MFSNKAAISHMTQCEMPLSRSAMAVAAATAPTPTWPRVHSQQGNAGGAGDQQHAEHVIDDLEAADQAHLAVHAAQELAHGGAREAGFAARVRKQLDRRDIGVGVGDAPGHQRARIGLGSGHGRRRGTK